MSAELTGTAIGKAITVIGIVGVLGIGAAVMQDAKVGDETSFLAMTTQSIRAQVTNDSDATFVTTANVAASKLAPDSRISGSTITSPWGTLTFAPANVLGTANDGFTITYPPVSTSKCNKLATNNAAMANTVTINGTVVKSTTSGLNSAGVSTQCATSPATIIFGFSRQGGA